MYKALLLPHYFKNICLVIILLCIAVPVIYVLTTGGKLHFLKEYKPLYISGLLTGSLLIALARDKEEDELVMMLRLKALAFAVVLGMADAIFQPLVDLVFKDPLSNGRAGEVLFYMNIL